MKNLIRAFVFLAIIAIAACKKDKLDAPVLPDSNDVVETPIDSAHISGLFRIRSTYIIENDSVLIPGDTVPMVDFTDATSGNSIFVNAVSVNGVPLLYDPSKGNEYTTSSYIGNITAASWSVKGNAIIPDFNFINQQGLPVYELYKSLPKTVDRTKDFVFPLTDFLNTTMVSIDISDHVKYGVLWGVSAKSATLTIPVNCISLLTPNPLTEMEVRFENHHLVSFGNKTFCFINEIILRKKIQVL